VVAVIEKFYRNFMVGLIYWPDSNTADKDTICRRKGRGRCTTSTVNQ
jgi:hypothetical protein